MSLGVRFALYPVGVIEGIRLIAITGERGSTFVDREEGAFVRRALPHHVRNLDPGARPTRTFSDIQGALVAGAGHDNQVLLAALLDLLLIVANIGRTIMMSRSSTRTRSCRSAR